jgi:hypothetical protein
LETPILLHGYRNALTPTSYAKSCDLDVAGTQTLRGSWRIPLHMWPPPPDPALFAQLPRHVA